MNALDDEVLQRIVLANRWVLLVPLWSVILVFGWQVVSDPGMPVLAALLVTGVCVAVSAVATGLAGRSLHGRTVVRPGGAAAAVIAVSVAASAAAPFAVSSGMLVEEVGRYVAPALAVLPAAVVCARAPWPLVAVLVALTALPTPLYPKPWIALVLTCGAWAFGIATVRLFGWSLDLAYRLDAAHRTEARLAVVEERLRFARDLHDTIGRNLAVIALRSELAARLTGEPATAERITEIQELARHSQEEIREVVRGYRAADLAVELEGARSVLRAAGVDCRLSASLDPAGLDDTVRTALGWTVREGVTNVIRHSQASYCGIDVTHTADAVVLTLTNDGAHAQNGTGTGLTGLAQRLADHGGSLDFGADPGGTYRLTARVPRTDRGRLK